MFKHLDDSRKDALEALADVVSSAGHRAVLIDDLYGRLSVALWPEPLDEGLQDRVASALAVAGGPAWAGTIWIAKPDSPEADKLLLRQVWEESSYYSDRIRILERVRNRTGWFHKPSPPPWIVAPNDSRCPIVAFCSFKGGVGRTTGLASYALAEARLGKRVVIVDLDLDAPGIATLFGATDADCRWGVVDYLMERPLGSVPLEDYFYSVASEVVEPGSVEVMSAGRIDDQYLLKLARLDLDVDDKVADNPLLVLLEDVRQSRRPDCILIDTRAGLSGPAGLVMAGIAHLYVVFATASSQSDAGLRRFASRLGAERLEEGLTQSNLLVVHSMVPEEARAASLVEEEFTTRLETLLEEHYLVAAEEDPDDEFWSVADMDSAEAPTVPVPIPYTARLAALGTVSEAADVLVDNTPYRRLHERIRSLVPEQSAELATETT